MEVMWSGHLGVQSQCKVNGGCLHPSSFQPSLSSQDPGPLGAWVPLITHSSLRIDACTLWNLHNRSDTLDTVKLLVPPWWSGWIRMSYDWLCMNLPELTSFDAQVKSAQDNMLLPSGYLYPDLDGFIIFCFATSIPQGKCWLRCFSRVNMLWTPWHRFSGQNNLAVIEI